ncbi:Ankyrin repeat-containing domain protein [Hyaloscypha variabilis]
MAEDPFKGKLLGSYTLLQIAALFAQEETMMFVLGKLDKDMKLEQISDENEHSLLGLAMQNKNEEIFKLLARRFPLEFSLRNRDKVGRTALSYAAERGQVWALNLCLKECPEHADLKDYCGRTPLSYAAENGNIDIVQLLFKPGVGSEIDNQGRSPLWYAIENRHDQVIEFLRKTQADHKRLYVNDDLERNQVEEPASKLARIGD